MIPIFRSVFIQTMTATALVENEKISFYDKVGALLMDHHFHVSCIIKIIFIE